MICGIKSNDKLIKCHKCKRWCHFEKCSGVSVKLSFDEAQNDDFVYTCSLCSLNCKDPFISVKDDREIIIDEIILESFIKTNIETLENIYNTRDENEQSRRFNAVQDKSQHLKWDYSTAFINLDMSIFLCNEILKSTSVKDKDYASYVMLPWINAQIFHKYYGISVDSDITMVEKYKQLNDINDFNFEYPSPYTLDMVAEAI